MKILNTYTVWVMSNLGIIGLILSIIVFVIGASFFGIGLYFCHEKIEKISALLMMFSLVYTTLTFIIHIGQYEETRYQVLLDDTIPYIEFNEQYEIIGQKGHIYTIKEREKEGD